MRQPPLDVLIVDDQASFRRTARMALELTRCFRVVGEASSGEQAVEMASALRPDVVLMDVVLPGIDGVEAVRRIGAGRPEIRSVLVSAYPREELPAAALAGGLPFLPKEDLEPKALADLLGIAC